ncbi:hypothetical protein SO802_019625 [Lithocarpus litseifolius]|uniref:RNA methyltransferase n=1 Tax=Lithocarpus litseifolius TaxID=425828 RepID=A0AAW2CRH5_9ROSI
MEQQHQHSKRKRKPVFVFGNYKNYYGYRIGQDLQEDPRLNVFKKELFEDKECLDIGCNSGIITILIAKKFRCRSILGIDIDSGKILFILISFAPKFYGGVLVLEPQPWKSYENNRLVSETTAMNYRSILFRPAKFQEILLDKIGFRKVEDITSHLSGSKTGFNRPILVFHK